MAGRAGWWLGALLACVHAAAGAAELRRGEFVELPAGEVVQDDLYVLASHVRISGVVQGDLVVLAQDVEVDGVVTGDVLGVAQQARVRGNVGRSVRLAGQEVVLSGRFARDALALGQEVRLERGAEVKGDTWLAGMGVAAAGRVGRGVRAAGRRVALSGQVGGEALVRAGRLVVGSSAALAGPLRYESGAPATMEPGATVAGPVEAQGVLRAHSFSARATFWAWMWARLFLGFTFAGLLLGRLAPGLSREAPAALLRAPLQAFGTGALALLLVVPLAVAVVALGVYVGGAWLGLMLLLSAGVALCLAPPVVGWTVGGWARLRGVPALVAGSAVLALALLVPWVGLLVAFGMFVLGVGAVLQAGSALRRPLPA